MAAGQRSVAGQCALSLATVALKLEAVPALIQRRVRPELNALGNFRKAEHVISGLCAQVRFKQNVRKHATRSIVVIW